MNDVDFIKRCLLSADSVDAISGREAMERVADALRRLTAEHGSQCKCPGCEVLREVS